jgi:hypothetical protein
MNVSIGGTDVAHGTNGPFVSGLTGDFGNEGEVATYLRGTSKRVFDRGNFLGNFSFRVTKTLASCDAAQNFGMDEALNRVGKKEVILTIGATTYTFQALVRVSIVRTIGATITVQYSIQGELPSTS